MSSGMYVRRHMTSTLFRVSHTVTENVLAAKAQIAHLAGQARR